MDSLCQRTVIKSDENTCTHRCASAAAACPTAAAATATHSLAGGGAAERGVPDALRDVREVVAGGNWLVVRERLADVPQVALFAAKGIAIAISLH